MKTMIDSWRKLEAQLSLWVMKQNNEPAKIASLYEWQQGRNARKHMYENVIMKHIALYAKLKN